MNHEALTCHRLLVEIVVRRTMQMVLAGHVNVVSAVFDASLDDWQRLVGKWSARKIRDDANLFNERLDSSCVGAVDDADARRVDIELCELLLAVASFCCICTLLLYSFRHEAPAPSAPLLGADFVILALNASNLGIIAFVFVLQTFLLSG